MQKPSLTAKEASQGTLRFTYVTFMLTLYHKSQQHFVYILKIHSLQTKLHSKYTPFMVSIFHLNFPSIITLMLASQVGSNGESYGSKCFSTPFLFWSIFTHQYFLNLIPKANKKENCLIQRRYILNGTSYNRYELNFIRINIYIFN